MAATFYDNFRAHRDRGRINLESGVIKVVLVKSTYVFSAADNVLADIASGDRIVTWTVAGKTVSEVSGTSVFDANDVAGITWGVAAVVDAFILYLDSGSESSSYLIFYNDAMTGLPTGSVTTLTIAWPAGGIFTTS